MRHALSCLCPNISRITNQILTVVLIDVSITFDALIGKSNGSCLMVRIIEKMDIQVQQVSDKECQQDCSVFAVIGWIIEVLLYKIRLLIAELLAIGLIFECELYKVQEAC